MLLRVLTCHIGSHSVTCHPTEMTFPPLPQPKLVLDWATAEGCKAEQSCLCMMLISVACAVASGGVSGDVDGTRWLVTSTAHASTRGRTQRQARHELPHVRRHNHARSLRHQTARPRPHLKGTKIHFQTLLHYIIMYAILSSAYLLSFDCWLNCFVLQKPVRGTGKDEDSR